MSSTIAAYIYAVCAALPIAMQVALAFGAPLGRFANGGRFEGKLPPVWRALAVVQGVLLAGMAWIVLDRANIVEVGLPPLLFWIALGLTVLTTIANAASPSRPERLTWTPVTVVMSLSGLAVALL